MRLTRLFKAWSFRLTLLYAGLFSLSVLILFGVVFWSAARFMSQQIDQTVANELAEIQADAAGGGLLELQRVVGEMAAGSPGIYYLLQDADQHVLAGNMLPMTPETGIMTLRGTHQAGHVKRGGGLRGRGLLVAEGAYLFVGLSVLELDEMREAIAGAFLLGLAVTVVLVLVGGVAMSLGLLRRVEAISRTSREIMAGDLGRRIDVRGTDDEFDHLAASLNVMLDRIQTLMADLQQVSNDIAHDLRTPLTRLRQRLELARWRGRTVSDLHEALDGSISDVDAILDTFGALLRIAQIEAGMRKGSFLRVDLSELLAGMVETYDAVTEEKGQKLTNRIEPGLAVRGDRELLTQLFSNLIENAINHSPDGIAIAIEGLRTVDHIRVTVSDGGPGIPEAFQSKVYQRFFRLEASRTTKGNGLGLSLVAAIAELHDAAISLEDNRPGLRVRLEFTPYQNYPN